MQIKGNHMVLGLLIVLIGIQLLSVDLISFAKRAAHYMETTTMQQPVWLPWSVISVGVVTVWYSMTVKPPTSTK
ncbi:MAG: hypothetical protein ACYC35_06040 [Pirellulales bacterium]